VSITEYGPSAADLNETVVLALNSCQGRELLNGTRYRVINSGFTSDPMPGYGDVLKSSISLFRATVYDYTRGLTILWRGVPGDLSQIFSSISNEQPLPNAEEIAEAASIAGARLDSNEVVHSSLPPVITREFADGSSHRILNIVINSGTSSRIVEVNMNNRSVVTRVPSGGPSCHAPKWAPIGVASDQGVPGTVNFVISQGGRTLWTFQAVRPSSSSGLHGSGIELRNVKYNGKTVLYRAHVPILNVEYEREVSGCGRHYRDLQWAEFPFQCNGSDISSSGFRLCSSPAKTILDTNVDGGNFRGVAVYVEGQEVVLKSVMLTGWYRYISEWRFHVNGSLRPRWGFAGVLEGNQCICVPHHHHVYWRFDFDIETAGNNLVREFNNPPIFSSNYHDKLFEIRRLKDPSRQRHWEISNMKSGRTYALIPGPNDGTSSGFGVGDVWILQYHGNELDDGFPKGVIWGLPEEVKEHIDDFLTGEVVKDKDVVIWYAAHFRHVQTVGHTGHIVGPDIHPIRW